jgi:hypothetical protein
MIVPFLVREYYLKPFIPFYIILLTGVLNWTSVSSENRVRSLEGYLSGL